MKLGKFVVTCLVLKRLLQIRTSNSIVAVFNWLCLSADLVARIELNHSDHGETEATAIVQCKAHDSQWTQFNHFYLYSWANILLFQYYFNIPQVPSHIHWDNNSQVNASGLLERPSFILWTIHSLAAWSFCNNTTVSLYHSLGNNSSPAWFTWRTHFSQLLYKLSSYSRIFLEFILGNCSETPSTRYLERPQPPKSRVLSIAVIFRPLEWLASVATRALINFCSPRQSKRWILFSDYMSYAHSDQNIV